MSDDTKSEPPPDSSLTDETNVDGGSAGSAVGRIATLLVVALLGTLVAWEGVTYVCYLMSVNDVRNRMEEAKASEDVKPLRLRNVMGMLYGAPTIDQGSHGDWARASYQWDGLLLSHTMHLLYDREDMWLYIEELHTDALPPLDDGAADE